MRAVCQWLGVQENPLSTWGRKGLAAPSPCVVLPSPYQIQSGWGGMGSTLTC